MTYAIVSPIMMVSKKPIKIRSNKIKSTSKKLQYDLNNKVELALIVCNPEHSIHHASNNECAIIWKEIEHLSNSIYDMNKVVRYLENDWESFIELDCKL